VTHWGIDNADIGSVNARQEKKLAGDADNVKLQPIANRKSQALHQFANCKHAVLAMNCDRSARKNGDGPAVRGAITVEGEVCRGIRGCTT
jgi:hypothetical protein